MWNQLIMCDGVQELSQEVDFLNVKGRARVLNFQNLFKFQKIKWKFHFHMREEGGRPLLALSPRLMVCVCVPTIK